MAKSTYLELVQKVHAECSLSGNPPSSVANQLGMSADLVRWVADAAYEIEASHGNWDFMWSDDWSASIVADDTVIAAPTDMGEWDRATFILDATTDDYVVLEEMGYKDWKKNYSLGSQTADTPSYFIIRPDHSVGLWPKSDSTYTLTADRWVKPTRLSGSTDTSAIPEEFERVIIALAKIKYAEDQGAMTVLVNAQTEYEDWMLQLETAEMPNQKHRRVGEQTPLVVRPV